jgi:hypothetical protein
VRLTLSVNPVSNARVADGGFSVTVRHDREGKRGNGFGQHDGLAADTVSYPGLSFAEDIIQRPDV